MGESILLLHGLHADLYSKIIPGEIKQPEPIVGPPKPPGFKKSLKPVENPQDTAMPDAPPATEKPPEHPKNETPSHHDPPPEPAPPPDTRIKNETFDTTSTATATPSETPEVDATHNITPLKTTDEI